MAFDSDNEPGHDAASPNCGPLVTREIPCRGCGGPLTGLPFGAACPECGTPVSESLRAHHAESSDGSLALLFGALSVVAPILSLLFAPVTAIFFVRARRSYLEGEASKRSMVVAAIGLVMAGVALVALLVLVVLVVMLR